MEGAEGGAWGVEDLPGVPPTTYAPRHLSAAPLSREWLQPLLGAGPSCWGFELPPTN